MTTRNNMQGHIYGLIETVKQSEKVTKATLSILSRDILSYVLDSQDIAAVNRLVGVLTPQNKATAILFFKNFLPWQAETDNNNVFQRFGKKAKGEKTVLKKELAIAKFLAVATNDIWTWAAENVTIEKKPKDYAGLIQKAIANALKGDDVTEALDRSEIIMACFKAGITLDDMLSGCEAQEAKLAAEKEAAKAVEAAANAEPEFEPNH